MADVQNLVVIEALVQEMEVAQVATEMVEEDLVADDQNFFQQSVQVVVRHVNFRSALPERDQYSAVIVSTRKMMRADTVLSSAPSVHVNFVLLHERGEIAMTTAR